MITRFARCCVYATAFTFVLAVFTSPAASQVPSYVAQWGSSGNGDGRFSRPVAVVVNSHGEVYVGDAGQPYLQRFTSGGQFINRCMVACPVAMALAIDRTTDVVFASDPGQNAVQVYTRDLVNVGGRQVGGDPVTGIAHRAYGIAIAPNGELFVAEGARHSVTRRTQDGELIQRWSDPGPGPSQLQSAWGIGVDASGHVYVADYVAARVLKFGPDGSFVTAWGSRGTGYGQFAIPTNVCADWAGNILVTEPYNNRVEVFTPDGAFLSSWGTQGTAPGKFNEPYGAATYAASV